MTTASWSTVVDQSTDAAFRTWGSELNTKFAAVGMVQTADTGQINWATVTRASGSTAAGYEIWKLSSGNLYFKIEYGSGNTNAIPANWITVGTGSNGSGTLTGQLSTRTEFGSTSTAITSTVTNYQSYLCATANYFSLAWKLGSGGTANRCRTFVAVMQTVDSTGAASSVGYFVVFNPSVTQVQSQCVATAAGVTGTIWASNTTAGFFIIPDATTLPASSQDGAGNNQAFLWWYSILGTTPVAPLLHGAMILLTDLAVGNTASMTLVGSTPHTYINASISHWADPPNLVAASGLGIAMLWE